MIADPSRQFYLNTLFIGDQEIASFKNYEDKIFDFQGEIPDRRQGAEPFGHALDLDAGHEWTLQSVLRNSIRSRFCALDRSVP